MLSESTRQSLRNRSMVVKSENFDMLEAMRSELQTETQLREEATMYNPTVSFGDMDTDYPLQSIPQTPYALDEESVEEKTEASTKSKSDRQSIRSSIRMNLTPTSKLASPTSSSSGRKSVLKGGNSWKAERERRRDTRGDDFDGDGQSVLKVKTTEQIEAERIDPEEHEHLQRQLMEVTAERDALKMDRETWLDRLKADNVKLAGMLKHVKDLKVKLVHAVDEAITEKMALRSMKVDYLNTSLENYLLGDDCSVSESRRALLPLMQKEAAQKFCSKLMGLTATCRANQAEILDFVTELTKDAEAAFVRGDHEDTQAKVEALMNIASTRPGNIMTAKAVAESLTEGMVGAMIDKASETLMRRGEHLSSDPTEGTSAADARAERLEEELKLAMNQNESLKANVGQLRKRYNTLLEKASAKSMSGGAVKEQSMFSDEVSKNTKVGPGRGRSPAKKGGGTRASKAAGGESVTQALPPVPPVNVSEAFDELPFEVRKEAHELLTQFVSTVVGANPLGKGLRPIVIKETINDVVEQLHGTVGAAMGAYRDHMGVQLETMNKDDRKAFLVRAIQMPIVRSEASVYVHMLLTYLYSRYKSNEAAGKAGAADADSGAPVTDEDNGAEGRGAKTFTETSEKDSTQGPSVTSASYLAGDAGAAARAVVTMPTLMEQNEAVKGEAGAMARPKFKPTARQSAKESNKNILLPGTAGSTEGTGASGNVFFASSLGGGPEEVVMTLEPTPTAPGKVKPNSNLPKYMQPVPKKRDRR